MGLRFFGEWMAHMFPKGINPFYDRTSLPIIAGAYAVAGSAAFAGANTGRQRLVPLLIR